MLPKFKEKVERETDINFVSGIGEIQFPLHSIFLFLKKIGAVQGDWTLAQGLFHMKSNQQTTA